MATLAEIQAELRRRDEEALADRGPTQGHMSDDPISMCDIACTRYEGGEDKRVAITLGHAIGTLESEHVLKKIARLHDHKGILVVMSFETLTFTERNAFERAWFAVYEDSVEFIDYNDDYATHFFAMVRDPILTPEEFARVEALYPDRAKGRRHEYVNLNHYGEKLAN